ncbi:MAG: hypothetical protein Q8P69_01780 [bacterium]|nr:hypothetical protein [bacterium]
MTEKLPKPEVNPEQEEQDGLERYYSEIVPDSICEANFKEWESHLQEELDKKYKSFEEKADAIKRAEEFIKTLPLFHGTDLDNLVNLTKTGSIKSNFISHKTGLKHESSGNTAHFDRENELDHFVYFFVGYPKNIGWEVQMFLKPELLDNPKVRVSLEDHGWGTTNRLVEARSRGLWPYKKGYNSPSSEPESTFEIQKSQIWRGPDFQRLLPLMLALSYDNPEEFHKETPVPSNLIPEGHLPILDDEYRPIPYFPKFEVRIPSSVATSDVLLVVYDRGFEYLALDEKVKRIEKEMEHRAFDTLRIPPGLTPEKREEIIREAVIKRMSKKTTDEKD